jgi:hypothetical protein
MGMVSIKVYDKFGQILRIEITVKDVTFFGHYPYVRQSGDPRTLNKPGWQTLPDGRVSD